MRKNAFDTWFPAEHGAESIDWSSLTGRFDEALCRELISTLFRDAEAAADARKNDGLQERLLSDMTAYEAWRSFEMQAGMLREQFIVGLKEHRPRISKKRYPRFAHAIYFWPRDRYESVSGGKSIVPIRVASLLPLSLIHI